ncbi:unnamed protein product [Clonostachys rhizophaga]|uniref:Vegetative incompatibility protein HET-E-1 n=1 Tax=Clonostachys rhizophaga TaxID=160324 RepID=A0A9N9VQC3_9HYPO|nr:unnamed protein product [Clonostachys rhizophaga]
MLSISDRKHSNVGLSGETQVESGAHGGQQHQPRSSNPLEDSKFSNNTGHSESSPTSGSYFTRRFTKSLSYKWRDKSPREEVPVSTGLRLLHNSNDPQLDLIFVHGLKGHPVKTWRKSGDEQTFWPQCWLPSEPGFEHVNIHTFGYEANFADAKLPSILTINDFGQSLFEQMRNCPHLRNNERAFLLARETPEFQSRIQTIFFLGTPHRGSKYAKILSRILSLSGSSSPNYVKDLELDSVATQVLNEDFSKQAHDIHIYSFYETKEMKLGMTSGIVVPRNSAILGPGFKNERVQYLIADHKEMCKFNSPKDANFTRLANALSEAVEGLLTNGRNEKKEESKEQLNSLMAYLSLPERLDERYHAVEGSCQWIDEFDEFKEWKDVDATTLGPHTESSRYTPAFLWVHANPGTGKTVLAAHVVKQLQELDFECASHYFHLGGRASQSLAYFLRSIVFQMAAQNTVICEKLLNLCDETSLPDLDDGRSIWSKLFSRGIFQIHGLAPQYWVVDAMDECVKYQEFFTMLKGEQPSFPLRIFVTSRTVPDMARLCRLLEATLTLSILEISERCSMYDISCYIEARRGSLPATSAEEQSQLAAEILRRSNACFLWVKLVLDELEQVYSSESIFQVLHTIPDSMVPYYERTIVAMLGNKHEKHIAKALLLWTVGSTRQLKATELSQALKMDIEINLPNPEDAIKGLCGQLISVDKYSGIVDVVHPTVREFLLTDAAGEFKIRRSVAHERIALVCLKALMSHELQPSRGRPGAQRRVSHSPFLSYAMTQFSEHVQGASSESSDLLMEIDRFFRTNALIWIEHIAHKGDLHVLMRASKNLRAYLDRRAKSISPPNHELKHIEDWSTDLSRILTKFGDALLMNPSAIYFLIPPLCPRNSAIHSQFGGKQGSLKIIGFSQEVWDDCAAELTFGEEMASSVSCGENLVAVSMASGLINLYSAQSFQQVGALHSKWSVDIVCFTDESIIVCTTKTLSLFDRQGGKIWEKKTRTRCIYLTIYGDEIFGVSEHGAVLTWAMPDGRLLDNYRFEFRNHQADTEYNQLQDRVPSVASISPDMQVLALGYRSGTVCLWDIQSKEFITWALDDRDRQPSQIIFNPNPNINLFVVMYANHTMTSYEAGWGQMVHSYTPPRQCGVSGATCSPDGRTLATTNTLGHLQIWDFETLTLLYDLEAPSSSSRSIRFTSSGTSIIDLTSQSMRVWSPSALIRNGMDEEESIRDDVVAIPAVKGQYNQMRSPRITALCAHPSLPLIFAGSAMGVVTAYSSDTGLELGELYSHSLKHNISHIAVSRKNALTSADSACVMMHKLDLSELSSSKVTSIILYEERIQQVVSQLCYSDSGEFLVLSSKSSHRFFSDDGSLVHTHQIMEHQRTPCQWFPIPARGKGSDFFLVHNWELARYSSDDFSKPVQGSEIKLQVDKELEDDNFSFVSGAIHPDGQTLVLESEDHVSFQKSSTTYVFELGKSRNQQLRPSCRLEADFCQRFFSISPATKNVNFLHRNSWLSSLSLTDLNKQSPSCTYSQHLFVPNELVASRNGSEARFLATATDNIIFCLHDKLVIDY